MSAVSLPLSTTLTVGNSRLSSALVLASMAGLGHVAFREVLAAFGGYGFMVTEMCNARAVPHENRHASPVFRWREEERGQPIRQIFGDDPEAMTWAAVRKPSRKYAIYPVADLVHGHSLWSRLVRGGTRVDMEASALCILGPRPQLAQTPNAFLFTA